MPVSREVPCSAFTIAPIDGCDVHPAHADIQRFSSSIVSKSFHWTRATYGAAWPLSSYSKLHFLAQDDDTATWRRPA